MSTGTPAPVDLAAVQRRTVVTLVGGQALGGVGITVGIATAALLAAEVSGSTELAGLVQTMQVLGSALAAYLLARLMSARGRRPGLAVGYLLGAAGAVLCVVAGVVSSYPLLLVAALLLGATTAANSQSRFAATDLAAPERRARALSTVVWATTVGAVAGPNLSGPAGRLAAGWGLPTLTGPFLLGALGMALAAAVVAVGLRPDPLLLARRAVAPDPDPVRSEPVRPTDPAQAAGGVGVAAGIVGPESAWRAVRTRPVLAAAVAGMALAHAAMVAVMIMTPLHMDHGGAGLEIIGVVISVHVLGMFAFAPVVGWAVDRAGAPLVLAAGAVLLLVSTGLSGNAPEGASWEIGAGLFLLGLGWSFATVAASALVTAASPLAVRAEVQGVADLAMGLTAAAAGASAGVIVGAAGYGWLNALGAVLACGVGLAAYVATRRDRFPASNTCSG